MRKSFFTAAALMTAMLMAGCGGGTDDYPESEISVTDSVTTGTSETASETSVTTSKTVTSAETTVSETGNETVDTSETTESETEVQTSETAGTDAGTETVSETLSAEELSAIMDLIEKNSKTVGNDTAGYITVYSGSGYEEDEYGDFIVTSENGATLIGVMFYDDLQTNLDQTAYMFCLTAVMNAEIDGFEEYNINSVTIDGMDGYFAVMIDDDEGTGFKLYAALVDSENGMLRAMSCESTDYTQENVIASSVVFDSYRRSDSAV